MTSLDEAYDLLETNSSNNDFCRLILNFMVNHPLEKYAKVRLLNIEIALKELNEIAKQLTNLSKLFENMENENKNKFKNVLLIFMIHISCIFARNMVEILIYLSFNIEPHVKFWENQYKLNNKKNKLNLYKNLTKIYTLNISSRRARIFKKLLSDLYIQIGNIQWWFWGLIKLKKQQQQQQNTLQQQQQNIQRFIQEMNQLFSNNNNNNNNNIDNNNNNKNIIDQFIETISFSDSFVIKIQKDIKIWGMPSHWRQNYKIYSFYTISILFTSILSYYNLPKIKSITNNTFLIIKNFFIEHFYEPMDEIFNDIFYFNSTKNDKFEYEESYKIEKETLLDMIKSFELKYFNVDSNGDDSMKLIMEQYKKDIENPISSATKGSLLTNIFIQIQKMKVEISKLLIDVDNIMDSNKINMEILATIPFIGLLYLLQQFWSNKNGKNKLKKESKKELRFIFRSIYSILIKNYNEQYVYDQECGLILFLIYKCYSWSKQNLNNNLLTNDEYQWLKFDINNFIAKEITIESQIQLLNRMERYFL